MSELMVPDWYAPLDVEERIDACPADAAVRGMFYQEVLDALKKGGKPAPIEGSFIGFKLYPTKDYMRLAYDGARALYPEEPPRRALYLLGLQTYPNFASTMVGKAVFAIAGRSFRRVVEVAPRAYDASIKPGGVDVLELRDGYARVGLRGAWGFPDCLQLGIWAGAMQVCGVEGDIRYRLTSFCDAELEIPWRDAVSV